LRWDLICLNLSAGKSGLREDGSINQLIYPPYETTVFDNKVYAALMKVIISYESITGEIKQISCLTGEANAVGLAYPEDFSGRITGVRIKNVLYDITDHLISDGEGGFFAPGTDVLEDLTPIEEDIDPFKGTRPSDLNFAEEISVPVLN